MNIYLGNSNISSLFHELRVGFEALGHSVTSAVTYRTLIQGEVDLDKNRWMEGRSKQFDCKFPNTSKLVREKFLHDAEQQFYDHACMKASAADLCLFVCSSFLPEWQDIPMLKTQQSKIAICFAGTEARVLPLENIFRKLTGSAVTNYSFHGVEKYLRHVRFAELYADTLLGATQAGFRPMYMPITTVLDCSDIAHRVSEREVPVIMHAPSKKSAKGTHIWMDIVSDLKAEGLKFAFRLLEDIPHAEFLKTLQHADILCDGLIHGGKISREAMAAGCVVLSSIGNNSKAYLDFFRKDDDTLRERWNVQPGSEEDALIEAQFTKKVWYYQPEINPCVPVSPETAKDRLREVILDKQKRISLARRGRPTMEKYCSPEIVARDILECVDAPSSFATQAKLSFHHSILYHDFIPQSQDEAAIYNRTTDIVRDTDWYKQLYPQKERDGLVF